MQQLHGANWYVKWVGHTITDLSQADYLPYTVTEMAGSCGRWQIELCSTASVYVTKVSTLRCLMQIAVHHDGRVSVTVRQSVIS